MFVARLRTRHRQLLRRLVALAAQAEPGLRDVAGVEAGVAADARDAAAVRVEVGDFDAHSGRLE